MAGFSERHQTRRSNRNPGAGLEHVPAPPRRCGSGTHCGFMVHRRHFGPHASPDPDGRTDTGLMGIHSGRDGPQSPSYREPFQAGLCTAASGVLQGVIPVVLSQCGRGTPGAGAGLGSPRPASVQSRRRRGKRCFSRTKTNQASSRSWRSAGCTTTVSSKPCVSTTVVVVIQSRTVRSRLGALSNSCGIASRPRSALLFSGFHMFLIARYAFAPAMIAGNKVDAIFILSSRSDNMMKPHTTITETMNTPAVT